MTRSLLAAGAGLLLLSTAALADQDHAHRHARAQQQGPANADPASERHGTPGPAPAEKMPGHGAPPQTQSPERTPAARPDAARAGARTGTQADARWGTRPGGQDNHAALSRFRANVRARERYHAPREWHAPRGYHYRRFTYGETLPSAFFAPEYWLPDYVAFGLMAPPPGYLWVREGPDALLVDRYTGEIIRVEYDVFY